MAFLEYEGLTAVAQTQRPPTTPANTVIKVYNGRETSLPATVALLEKVFGVQAQLVNDPSVTVDIIVTTGKIHAHADPAAGALTGLAAVEPQRDPQTGSPIGVSQWLNSGSRPADRVEVALGDGPADRPDRA